MSRGNILKILCVPPMKISKDIEVLLPKNYKYTQLILKPAKLLGICLIVSVVQPKAKADAREIKKSRIRITTNPVTNDSVHALPTPSAPWRQWNPL